MKYEFEVYQMEVEDHLFWVAFVHEQASELAKKQGISLNQYINDAIVYYNSMLIERNASNSKDTKSIDKTSNSIIQFGQS